MIAGAVIATVVALDLAGSSVEVAVMEADPEDGTVPGAVYNPEFEIVPAFVDHVTTWLGSFAPLTAAEH